jgi:hypothetical protein
MSRIITRISDPQEHRHRDLVLRLPHLPHLAGLPDVHLPGERQGGAEEVVKSEFSSIHSIHFKRSNVFSTVKAIINSANAPRSRNGS